MDVMMLRNHDSDDSSVTSREQAALDEETMKKEDEQPVIAKAETVAVTLWKMVVLSVLLSSALGVALAVYFYTNNAERDNFEDQFNNDATKIFEAIGSTLDISLGSVDSFVVAATSTASDSNMTWPFVTIVSDTQESRKNIVFLCLNK